MRRIAIIDVSSILHTVKHAIGGKNKLSYKEKPTFVIFGFLFRLRSIVMNSLADTIVFAYDSNKSLRRELYFKEYKQKRIEAIKSPEQQELDDLSFPQFQIVKNEIIPSLGFKNIFHAEGYEADDIIARVCLDYPEHEICIVTSDEDMYQLLSNNVSIMKPREYKWYTKTIFEHEYGIAPKDWRKVKVYGGCKTDGVPGLPIPKSEKSKSTKILHVAEGTALNYIKGKLSPDVQAYKAFLGKEAERIINRNKFLTILPLRGCPKFTVVPDYHLSREMFVSICRKYGFESMLRDINDYCQILRLK